MHLFFYDAQVQTGKRSPRGFKELFDQGASFRSQLELYATTSLDLNGCVIVLTELLAYALAPTQERDLEAEHGRIGARQTKALGAVSVPASVTATIRFRYWRHLLHSDAFTAFCHRWWLGSYRVEVMKPWSSVSRSKALSAAMQIAEIYQYDFAGQFASAAGLRSSLALWKEQCPPLSGQAFPSLTSVEKYLCQYWRSVLEVGGLYSIKGIPSAEGCLSPASNSDVLAAFWDRGTAVIPDVLDSAQVFFDVMHLNPAGRIEAECSCFFYSKELTPVKYL